MRILVHDYAGHPFQVQLSRVLAHRGHEVRHLYAASNPTPKGALAPRPDDPDGFHVDAIALDSPYERYNYLRRWRQERTYGRLLAHRIREARPEVVMCCNTPLDALVLAQAAGQATSAQFVFWVQDLLGIAAERILKERIPILGSLVGRHHIALERRIARASDALVLITDDFKPIMSKWGVPSGKLYVVENWAPLEDYRPMPRSNAWPASHDIDGCTTIVYTGMLGLKHNPGLILALARHLRGRPDVAIVIVSEGRGADWLRERKSGEGLENLILFDFQPYDRMSEVLASGDILLAILEPEAGIFSVPSKVLGYLCSGRPILASMPTENLAARILMRHEAGLVVDAGDADALIEAAERLINVPELRENLSGNARAYAEQTFNISAITSRFEEVFQRVCNA